MRVEQPCLSRRDEAINSLFDRRLCMVPRSAHVVEHCLIRVTFHQGHMLVRGRMEHA